MSSMASSASTTMDDPSSSSSSDFAKVFKALEALKFQSIDDVLVAFGIAHLPQAQKYGILFGCLTFLCTITAVVILLILGGTFDRMKEQAKELEELAKDPSKIPDAVTVRKGRPLLLERLLEARARMMKMNYPGRYHGDDDAHGEEVKKKLSEDTNGEKKKEKDTATTTTMTSLQRMLMNVAPSKEEEIVENVSVLATGKEEEEEKEEKAADDDNKKKEDNSSSPPTERRGFGLAAFFGGGGSNRSNNGQKKEASPTAAAASDPSTSTSTSTTTVPPSKKATAPPSKTQIRRNIPEGYERDYVTAYRNCQDKPGGPTIAGLPEARFEAYARAYAGCGQYTTSDYKRSYARMYEAIACQSHTSERKMSLHFASRPQDIFGKYVRLEALEVHRHLQQVHDATCGMANGDDRSFDPQVVWAFRECGPFRSSSSSSSSMEDELKTSPVFVKRPGQAAFAIIESQTDRLVGILSLTNDDPSNLSIDMEPPLVKPTAMGSREEMEACFLILDKLFALGYRRVGLYVDSQDMYGRKVPSRLGFTQEGIISKHRIIKNSNRDSCLYGMLNSDWDKGARAYLYRKLHGVKAQRVDEFNNAKEGEVEMQNKMLAENKKKEREEEEEEEGRKKKLVDDIGKEEEENKEEVEGDDDVEGKKKKQ